MSPIEYIMHPKTEIQSCSIKVDKSPAQTYFGDDEIAEQFGTIDWANSMVIGHNMSGFDSMILAWRFGIYPKMWGCTQAMGRIHAKVTSTSLRKLSEFYGIGKKLSLEATNTKGKRLTDFTPQELRSMSAYNKVDTDLCYDIFRKLYPSIPKREMLLIDMTTRMLVEPQFELDRELVTQALEDAQAEKAKALSELYRMLKGEDVQGMDMPLEVIPEEFIRSMMASAARFSKLLESRGVEVPMKPSPTNPERQVPALAKTDEAFLALQEHDDPVVATAATLRLSVKSTLLETRLEAFTRAADACGGKLPVPLKYAGADTTGRWSGEQYNCQNLPRIGAKPKPSDALRKSLRAPKGHKVVVADLSGIELRVNMFLWQVPYAMALFKKAPDKADLYKYFAAHDLYHIPEDEVTKAQRQLGKVCHLGLGFGAGSATFQRVAKMMGGVSLSAEEAHSTVEAYRAAHPEIVAGWKAFQKALTDIAQGTEVAIDPWGHCVTDYHSVQLPSGRRIYYPDLTRERSPDTGRGEWWYGNGRSHARIYAGKGVENLVQALARDVIAEHAVQFHQCSGLRPALMVHDELVYVVPDAIADDTLAELQAIMRGGVSWWPELVTWSEGDIADTYGDAK
jgi:DNA polymerase